MVRRISLLLAISLLFSGCNLSKKIEEFFQPLAGLWEQVLSLPSYLPFDASDLDPDGLFTLLNLGNTVELTGLCETAPAAIQGEIETSLADVQALQDYLLVTLPAELQDPDLPSLVLTIQDAIDTVAQFGVDGLPAPLADALMTFFGAQSGGELLDNLAGWLAFADPLSFVLAGLPIDPIDIAYLLEDPALFDSPIVCTKTGNVLDCDAQTFTLFVPPPVDLQLDFVVYVDGVLTSDTDADLDIRIEAQCAGQACDEFLMLVPFDFPIDFQASTENADALL